MQIEEALEQYTLQLRADGRSAHTVAQYRRHVRLLGRWAASVGLSGEVENLGHQDLARFLTADVATRCAAGRAKRATAMNALRSSLRTFFGYLHAAGDLPRNPASLIRRARCAPPPPRGLSEVEQERLLAALAAGRGRAAERDQVLFSLLTATGIRIGSALALEVRDVDLERGELELRRTKGDRPDRVPLGDEIREHLRGYLGGREAGPLFPGAAGAPITARQVQRRLALWCERAGIRRVSPHGLRHTFAMRVYSETGDLLTTQRALGHRSIAATVVYAGQR